MGVLPDDDSWKGEHLIRGVRPSHYENRPSGGGGRFSVANMKARRKPPPGLTPAQQGFVNAIRDAAGKAVLPVPSVTAANYASVIRRLHPEVGRHIQTVRGKGYRWTE